jgi:hypothetical protein
MALTAITYSNKSCKCESSDKSIIKKMMSLSLPLGKYTGVYIWQNTKKKNICAKTSMVPAVVLLMRAEKYI